MNSEQNKSRQPQIWQQLRRWHRRAGIIIAPILLVMAVTGGIYLLEPQIEDGLYGELLYLPAPNYQPIDHTALSELVNARYSVVRIRHYQPPSDPSQSAQFLLDTRDGQALTLFVDPAEGKILGAVDEKFRLTNIAKKIHGGLMAGTLGEVIVELVACWTILMVISGLYLWWPRALKMGGGLRGLLVPRFDVGGRALLRDLHTIPGALLGLWILAIIATGLPWSLVWGGLLERGGEIAGEGLPKEVFAARPQSEAAAGRKQLDLNSVMAVVDAQDFHHSYRLDYPWGPQGSFTVFPIRRGGAAEDSAYFFIDQYSGNLLHEIRWRDMGAVGRATTIGVQLHEGRLFGAANQLLNLTALVVLIGLTVTGCLMWWRRRSRALPAKNPPADMPRGLIISMVLLGLLLPLAGISILTVYLFERWKARRAASGLVTTQ